MNIFFEVTTSHVESFRGLTNKILKTFLTSSETTFYKLKR